MSKKNVLTMHLLAVGRYAVSKIRKKAKKREDEIQYIKEEREFPWWGRMGSYPRRTGLKGV